MQTLVLALDLGGTFVFALSGAMAGVRHRLDVFGVLVLSFAAATAGGITRDLLIGAVPPAAVADWRYVVISLLAGLTTFRWHPIVHKLQDAVLIFDAAGLALFAVSGTLKALAFGANPVAAVLLGMLTGIGGGMALLRPAHRRAATRLGTSGRPPGRSQPELTGSVHLR
jgi:uncharacterized membrane protein YeiH